MLKKSTSLLYRATKVYMLVRNNNAACSNSIDYLFVKMEELWIILNLL
jgi:hypothetical protein